MPSKHDSPATRKGTIALPLSAPRDRKMGKYPRLEFPAKDKPDEYSLAWTKAYLNPRPETQVKKADSIKITNYTTLAGETHMLMIEPYYSDIEHHDLPKVEADLLVSADLPGSAEVSEFCKYAGDVRTPWPIDELSYDNRGESFREFACVMSGGKSFPISLRDCKMLVEEFPDIPVSAFLRRALARLGCRQNKSDEAS